MRISLSRSRWLLAAALAATLSHGVAAPAQAQIPGLLPSIEDVVPGAPLPIDGIWRIREIGALILIQEGHASAIDGWTHALVFQIMPDQVVIRNLTETGDGRFVGDDLPLMSQVTLTPASDGTLRARTKGLVPASYTLEPVSPAIGNPGDDDPIGPVPPIDDPWDGVPDDPPPPDDWVSPW
ncbi:hypothetical protein [Sphingorhabdus sp. SMR4y]|uniref:hypothetical protein n=1 Tax=Sphingorhabdus sp. SMR4y TaxID=2584094 RepID=UPI000B5FE3BD|nr:hypothetical protein [Sphingorhabdus sp. SMR4y]ASK89300.1 hypothetical protein SPHFLASMR4Y_02562 [Sphingorhabdus sp. SMR4y]